ncbi:MAG: hypothetical protein ACP5OP_02755 [Leptospirillia bacterium]
MDHTPFNSPDVTPAPSSSAPRRSGWKRTVGIVFLLVAIVPALVLFVFYYREVSVTYYMTRNPLSPAAAHLATRMQAIVLGNMRALGVVAGSIVWSPAAPDEKTIRHIVGRYVQEGDLAAFSGIAVTDAKGAVLTMFDRRDISPHLDLVRTLSQELVARGGRYLATTIVTDGVHPDVVLMTAVRSGGDSPGKGGVLVALQNLSGELGQNLPVPRFRGAPGRSYLLSSDGLVLASSDPGVVGRNLRDFGRGGLLESLSQGKSGIFVESVKGDKRVFGSALLGDVTGITPTPWFAVLEAPNASLDSQIARTRLNMDLIVFLLVPAFFLIIVFIVYKSFRA